MSAGFYREPLLTDRYPYPERPIDTLRRCGKCGRTTFLTGPCPECGEKSLTPFWQIKGEGKSRFRRMVLCPVLLGGAALAVLGFLLLGWGAAAAAFGMTVGATIWLSREFRSIEDEEEFWRFHTRPERLFHKDASIPPVDPSQAESILDAWFFDMDVVERQALLGCWEEALDNGRRLSRIYRNRRLSRLLIKALLTVRPDGRDCFDLNEICTNLVSQDIEKDETVPFLRLVNGVVRNGGSLENSQMKRLYFGLLSRYLETISGYQNIGNLHDAVGDLFLYCGGWKDETGWGIPKEGEPLALFLERLQTELIQHRREFIDTGRWYSALRNLKDLRVIGSEEVLTAVEKSYFHRIEHLEKDNLYDLALTARGRTDSTALLHPEQRRAVARTLKCWVVDENGTSFAKSSRRFLRELVSQEEQREGFTDEERERQELYARLLRTAKMRLTNEIQGGKSI